MVRREFNIGVNRMLIGRIVVESYVPNPEFAHLPTTNGVRWRASVYRRSGWPCHAEGQNADIAFGHALQKLYNPSDA